ncbi:MAG TPA: cupin domain-containing protein [Nevskiaceae bacterium]|nr:cupin domain-containing protein [Nevskiaceae bacterium]
MRKFRSFAFASAFVAASLLPAQSASAAGEPQFVNAADIKWGNPPPGLPQQAKFAVLMGDPGKEGPFVVRLKMPAGYKVPAHWHSIDEIVTVISGTLYLGMGDKLDESQGHELKAGGFHSIAAKTHHYAYSKKGAVVQVHGSGPFDIHYINPDDDPSKPKDSAAKSQ